jgi:hypothetical protein
MSAPFNDLRHGELDNVLDRLEQNEMDEQELRAVLQNVIENLIALRKLAEHEERRAERERRDREGM